LIVLLCPILFFSVPLLSFRSLGQSQVQMAGYYFTRRQWFGCFRLIGQFPKVSIRRRLIWLFYLNNSYFYFSGTIFIKKFRSKSSRNKLHNGRELAFSTNCSISMSQLEDISIDSFICCLIYLLFVLNMNKFHSQVWLKLDLQGFIIVENKWLGVSFTSAMSWVFLDNWSILNSYDLNQLFNFDLPDFCELQFLKLSLIFKN